ncbi:MAG: hypothetical protein ACLQAT_23850 [Candidatus Binataceae bacterium]
MEPDSTDQIEPNPTDWNRAARPNYTTNKDHHFPYSEIPSVAQYHLEQLSEPIDILDFWGEGRTVVGNLVTGFPSAYNINHQYKKVSNGSDKGRKIPNRIPTVSFENVSVVNSYLPHGIANNVTLMGSPIIKASAEEIAKLVNPNNGRVVIYGIQRSDPMIAILETELNGDSLYYHPHEVLPSPLDSITLTPALAYRPAAVLAADAAKAIAEGRYPVAGDLLEILTEHKENDLVETVLSTAAQSYRIFPLSVVLKLHWPSVFQKVPAIVRDVLTGKITLTNAKFTMPLKLQWGADGEGDRGAFGGDKGRGVEPENARRFYWKPAATQGGDYFTFFNDWFEMPLKLEWNADGEDDRRAFGGAKDRGIEPNNADRFYWQLSLTADKKALKIQNKKFLMYLKVGWNADGEGDRRAYGGSTSRGIEPGNADRFYWSVQAI